MAPTTDPVAEWRDWRARRDVELAQPHGWLSLTALHWLTRTPAELDGLPGLWWGDEAGIHLDPTGVVGEPVRLGDAPVTEATVLWHPDADEAPSVTLGELALELVDRGNGNLAVRVRDPQAAARRAFTGVPVFDYDPRWRVTGTYRPYEASEEVTVGSAAPRVRHSRTIAGEVDLVLGGVPVTLKVSSGHGWSIAFRDASNGSSTTPLFRQVVLDGEPGAEVVVDFNRAANPPCAFSDHGTCPLPPPGNTVPVAVTAGERTPTGR